MLLQNIPLLHEYSTLFFKQNSSKSFSRLHYFNVGFLLVVPCMLSDAA